MAGGSGPLPGNAVVVRGGDMTLENLVDALDSHWDKHHDVDTGACHNETPHYCYALSANSLPGRTADEIATVARRPNPRMRVSDVDRITGSGFTITPTTGSRTGHCDLYLPPDGARKPEDEELQELTKAFDPSRSNPGRPERRP